MKKILALALVVLTCAVCFSMVSCSKQNEEASSDITEESKEPETMTLKVGTYNIHNGSDVKWDFSLIAQDILDKDLDVVGIQEVDQYCRRSQRTNTLAELKQYTGMQYGYFFKCIDYEGGTYGIAIISKYPIISTEEVELNDGTEVERRVLAHAVIDVNGKEINFFNTHLTIASDEIRANEFQIVKDKVKDYENCILVGDFNVDAYEEWEILKPLSYINNPETNLITHPVGDRKIDNICYSSEFTLVEDAFGIYQQNHSDHVLVYAEFVTSAE